MSPDADPPGGADVPLVDAVEQRRVVSSAQRFSGLVVGVRTDEVDLGDGQQVTRDVVVHPGAVGIVALDADDRVLLLRQYRHPVGRLLWEPPAGLLDVDGEPALDAARRELFEEAGLRAAHWDVLVDFFNSPGGSTESFRCFLARGLSHVADDERHVGEGEERGMPLRWVPLDEARDLVLAGHLHNPTAVSGVLAAWVSRAGGWAGLRPADAPWPEAPAHVGAG